MVASAAALWGTFSLFFRSAEHAANEAGQTLGSATESFVFFLVVLVALAPTALRKRPLKTPTREALLWLLFFTVADAVNVLAYFSAMQMTSIAVSVVTHYSAPLFVALLSPLLLKEPKTKGLWPALTVATLGLVLLVEPYKANSENSAGGALMGLLSGVLFAFVMMSMKRLGSFFSSDQILVLHYPGALLILYFFIPEGQLTHLPLSAWVLLILAGALPGVLGGLLFVEGIRHLTASRAGILTLIEPVVAGLLAIFVWNERPGALAYFGAGLVLFSAYRVITSPALPP